MSESASTSSAGGACRTEYKRQKIYLKTEKTFAKGENESSKDPLPIVELKPFVKKVWRRENSLPGYYDRFPPSKPSQHIRKQKDNERKLESPVTPSPSPDKLEMFIGNLQGDSSNDRMRSNGHHSPRSRGKLHPPAETLAPKQVEHSQSVVPGFITRNERTKSTLLEIQEPDAPSKIHCGLQQSLDRKEIDHPPIIDLKGEKIPQNSVGRKPLQYLNSFRNIHHKNGLYNSNNAYNEETFRKYLVKKYHRKNSMSQRPKTPFYDDFDRKGTLPSIQIGLSSIRKRPNKSRGRYDPISEYSNDNIMPARNVHKVGGISNSLHVLSKIGIPSKVERQLSFQLEIDLSRFRRSRDYFPFDMTPSELAKYYPPQSVSLTQGEMLLRKGLESNAGSRRRKVVREKSHKSAPDILETRNDSVTPRDDGAVTGLRPESEIKHTRLIDEEEEDEDEHMHMNGDEDAIDVPNNYDTQNTDNQNPITHVNSAVETDEKDNIENMVHNDKPIVRKVEKPIVKIATAKMEESSQGSVSLTARTDSLSNVTSDIIQNVKDANVIQDSAQTNEKVLISHEEEDDALGTTFLTSEPKAIPESVPV